MFSIVEITDDSGRIERPDLLAAAEPVHRQLRPHLGDYRERMTRVLADGARMVVAAGGEQVLGLAVYRLIENTADGRKLYVDDLVTDEQRRSSGVGRLLMQFLETRARQQHCDCLGLDSGVQRQRAHAFYFREGMSIVSFVFRKSLT